MKQSQREYLAPEVEVICIPLEGPVCQIGSITDSTENPEIEW